MEAITTYSETAPASLGWPVIAAVRLLPAWSSPPSDPAPGWRAETTTGEDPRRWDEAEPVADADGLVAERIGVSGARAERLRAHLAAVLTDRYAELRRLPDVDGALQLLHRDYTGGLLRLSVSPAPDAPPGPDVRTRLACIMTLLGDLLWVNNNNPVGLRARFGPRTEGDPADAAAAWWARTREDEEADPRDLTVGEGAGLRAVSVDEVRAALVNITRGGLTDLLDEYWDTAGDDWPPLPAGHIAGYLTHDLLDTILGRVRPEAVYATGYVPVSWADESGDEAGSIVFVGAGEVAVLDVDLSC